MVCVKDAFVLEKRRRIVQVEAGGIIVPIGDLMQSGVEQD